MGNIRNGMCNLMKVYSRNLQVQHINLDALLYIKMVYNIYTHKNKPSTLFSSGVMVAHFIPTLYFLIASAHSTVTKNNWHICIKL